MSSTTLAPSTGTGLFSRYHFMLRRLHSLTGILFGSYLIVHLTINATLVEGQHIVDGVDRGSFQSQVDKIHGLPFLKAIEWLFIFLPIIFHTLYGIYITISGQWNVGRYGYTRNWLYLFQRITAVIIMFFLLFHVLTFKGVFGEVMQGALSFNADYAFKSTVEHLNAAWWIWAVIYPIGVLASAFHLANGFYASGITWGLTISRTSQSRWAGVCGLIFLGSFGAGMAALVAGILNANILKDDHIAPASHGATSEVPAVVETVNPTVKSE